SAGSQNRARAAITARSPCGILTAPLGWLGTRDRRRTPWISSWSFSSGSSPERWPVAWLVDMATVCSVTSSSAWWGPWWGLGVRRGLRHRRLGHPRTLDHRLCWSGDPPLAHSARGAGSRVDLPAPSAAPQADHARASAGPAPRHGHIYQHSR